MRDSGWSNKELRMRGIAMAGEMLLIGFVTFKSSLSDRHEHRKKLVAVIEQSSRAQWLPMGKAEEDRSVQSVCPWGS
jgi:hypothetical protein